uniref:NAD(P)-binding domain-containing protein n=1 Tax=Craspedostauros australis TaxID=1486917 RepID=A0A7R9WVD3_9STRA|mmetsp:Transcript_2258/g.6248  ORF Transcript_2258/g.6248 Transcript_2258/m.6248 type:complete len:375 (+) Transcript_2258:3-1127(+)
MILGDESISSVQAKPMPFSVEDHLQNAYKIKSKPMTKARIEQLRGPSGPKYNVLVTGAAGFVGMHTCLELERLGMKPVGFDSINSYYSTDLKEMRIAELAKRNIPLVRGDVCDTDLLEKTIRDNGITRVIHLAAQAGVRYSLDHPYDYTRNNVECFVKLLETLVKLDMKETLVYASSSSVYGNNVKVPFSETDRVEDPASLYAATKRADELIAHTYFNLHNVSSVGLRFFTVYGPYGRPDMAPFIFTDKISQGKTIKMYNHGHSKRDFTYVDDIVQGVVNGLFVTTHQPEIINLGNGRPIVLADFIRLVERSVGHKAVIDSVGMQKGDVPVTYADIRKAQRLLGYNPTTPIEQGIPQFVEWFRKEDAGKYRMAT